MTNDTAELLERLRGLDIRLKLDGERLTVNAPEGALTAALRDELGRRRDEVKAHLAARALREPPPLVAVPRAPQLPVSHTQQRLWFIKQMDPGSHVYNVTSALRLTGRLEETALRRALAALMARHESLRTGFMAVDGVPHCAVQAHVEPGLECLDVGAMGAQERERAALDAVIAFSRRPIDITRAPLLKCLLVRIDETDHVLVFVIDHIVADGLSLGILLEDFAALYAQLCGAPLPDLPELPLQYLDYAEWERRAFAQGVLEDHLAYWQRQLAGAPELSTLPTDHARPAVQSSRGARRVMQLPVELAAQLKALARDEGATLFMVLLSAFQVLLHRHGGETDLPIGSAIANRGRAEMRRVIGFFANNIILRGDLSGNPTVRELIARNRELALKAYAHQAMPFDLLVQALQTRRTLDRSPLFQVLFVLHGLDLQPFELPGLRCQQMELPSDTARFDLSVDVFDLPIGLRIYFEYATDLYEAAFIEQAMSHYRQLLEAVVADPSARVGAIALLPEPEKKPNPMNGHPPSPERTAEDPVPDLLAQLERLGVKLSVDGDKLRVNAPKGAIDEALRERIGSIKGAIVAALSTPRAAATLSRAAPLPLSHMQQRLWFLKQFDPGNAAYNIPCPMRFEGDLDEALVDDAMRALVARHESLRTRFEAIDGVPYCRVEPEADLQIEHVDLSGVPEDERQAASTRELVAFTARPFDISRAPLLRTMWLRLSPSSRVYCFVVDHIVADGQSLGILLHELQLLYRAGHEGRPLELPPLPAQYVDLVARQNEAIGSGALAEHRRYWLRQLSGLPALLPLPTDRARPPVQTYRGARLIRPLSGTLLPRARELARRAGVTPFMVLLAAFKLLLQRHAGVDDIAVGTAVAHRNQPDAAGVVGFFANNIVLRSDLSGNPTVLELLTRVRETCVQGMSHQEMPFDMLVDALVSRRETDHSPLFQVLFVMHNWATSKFDLCGARGEPLTLESGTSRYDLSVDLFEDGDNLFAFFEYNTDLFDADTIERLMLHYEQLLDELLTRPQSRIDELRVLAREEQAQLVQRWNATAADYPREQTVHGLFEAQVRQRPQAQALVFEGEALGYAELNARANRLAHHLRALGAAPGALVGVRLERSVEMVVAVLGVLKAGAAYVPLDPAFPQERIDYMVADAQLAVVLTRELLAELPAGLPADDPAPLATAGDLAYVIYTSGSTGRPKGVMLEHRSVVNFLLSMQREPGLREGDRFVSVTTLSFDIAGLEIHGPLVSGGTVVLAPRATALDARALAALLERERADLLQATPSTWRLLLDSGWRGRAGLKMLCGGEALPRELAQRLLALDGELWNLYGPTETTIWSTLWRVTDATRAIPIGRPIANTQCYVLDRSGQPVPIGVAGELCIGGDGLARGYLRRDVLTAEKFQTIELPDLAPRRVYRTGDVVCWRVDGALEYVGRRDHQIKLRGFRIELGEIEAVLAAHGGVKDNAVQVREDTPGDQRLVAYVVAQEGRAFDPDAARATLRARLPEYMVPGQFVTLDALPLTPNGKVDRNALPAPQAQPGASGYGDEAQALMTPLQRRVAALWREVLQLDRVGLHSNFFDSGGHSLLLVRLQTALKREFGRELPLIELFQRTTVAAQADCFAAPQAHNAALERARERAQRQLHG